MKKANPLLRIFGQTADFHEVTGNFAPKVNPLRKLFERTTPETRIVREQLLAHYI
jgi:hypothetical protein